MYEIVFYEKADGTSPVREMIDDLRAKADTDKTSRIRLNRIVAHIDALAELGSLVGQPTVKHLSGDIWELRPQNDRILYFFASGGTYVLLHDFLKKTQKTPPREIAKALREMRDYLERSK